MVTRMSGTHQLALMDGGLHSIRMLPLLLLVLVTPVGRIQRLKQSMVILHRQLTRMVPVSGTSSLVVSTVQILASSRAAMPVPLTQTTFSHPGPAFVRTRLQTQRAQTCIWYGHQVGNRMLLVIQQLTRMAIRTMSTWRSHQRTVETQS